MSSPRNLMQLVTHLQQTRQHFAADTNIRPVDCDRACILLTAMRQHVLHHLDAITTATHPEPMDDTPDPPFSMLNALAVQATTLITLLRDFRSICQEHTATRKRQWRIITQQLDALSTTLAEISHHIPATEPLTDRPPTDTTSYRQVSAA